MEIPQSRSRSRPRPYAAEGKKPTHDFLSLCSPAHQDPSPSQGGYLKTHDFLQPLEQGGKNAGKEGYKAEVTSSEKSLPPAPPSSGEHILLGGIGTYSISHIANYISQGQRTPKPEGVAFTAPQSSSSDRNDENSNCSSYSGGGFTLWEESVVKKGKTGKENIAGNRHVTEEAGVKEGGAGWMASMERPSQSSSIHNHPSTTFSSLSSSQPSSAKKNHSFVDMMKSSNSVPEEEDDEDEFVIKKETSPHHKGVLSVKVDTGRTDQKPNTPRSKHSATEQRRRSKINDRFSMLRELIPHGDQKRDKASFLLEVIDYIQFLQEKVNKYEQSYQGWNNEPTKLTPWGNGHRPSDGLTDQPRPLIFAAKFEENNSIIAPTVPRKDPNIVESDMSSADTIKEIVNHSRLANQASAFPVRLLPNMFSPGVSSNAAASFPSQLASDADNTSSQCRSQLWHGRSCATDCTVPSDKLKEQDLTIESGTISISTVYSQGLLSTLTQALQTSGVDLSQATISVQIDLGKRANHRAALNSSTSLLKKTDVPSSNQGLAHSRLASTREETDKAVKRFKPSRN